MNARKPAFLDRLTGAILQWADEQHRRVQDGKYWQSALHDPRLMADIDCALARSRVQSPRLPKGRPARGGSMPWLLATARQLVDR